MSTPRLDKSREHGTIHPPYHKAMFSQDGCYFSGSGEFLFREGEEPGRPQAKSGAQGSAGASKAPASPPAPKSAPTAPAGAKTEASAVDLAAWAKGEVKYPFFTVKKAVAEAHPDIDTSNTKSIKEGLAAKSVI